MTEPCDLDCRRGARADRPQEAVPGRAAESCIAPHRGGRSRGQRDGRARFRPCAGAARRPPSRRVMRGDALPPLHGLPIGVKDLEDTAGPRTHLWQPDLSRPRARRRTSASSPRCATAGAIVLGKTNTPEFGAGANTRNAVYGATGNPFDPTRSAAGSSGGSAVALATGMVPIAPAPTWAARCATRPRSAASSASARRPAWCRARSARLAGRHWRCRARWRAPCRMSA